ncbi:MAG: LicD family protein [Ruminococcus sp.]|nr:LicD family protein [Ruminococcus sp.]
MNELQKKEFEILECFVKICNALNLKYFLVCGSALGAVKYKGFIPWDDDVDVALFREDYEVFLCEAPKMLPNNFFLQNYKSDPEFPAIYSKLRNSDTTYIERSASNLNINHGIYIDVFPLDGYPKGRLKRAVFELRKKIYKSLLSASFLHDSKLKKCLFLPFRAIGIHKKSNKIAESYEKMIIKYSVSASDIVTNHGNWQGKLDYTDKKIFSNGRDAIFEGLHVIIPYQYNAYLEKKYGDYRKDPPLSQQVGHHYYTEIDCCHSFKEKI